MRNSTKLLLSAATIAGAFTTAAPAFADDAPAWALTGYVDVTSDYKFRGISQNDRSPSPQGSLNLTGPNGFYVGAWASTVDFDPATGNNSTNPNFELDLYGGKHTDLWGIDWNIEPYYYIKIYYLIASINCAKGDFSSGLKFINTIVNKFKFSDRPNVFVRAEFLNIIIHYELKNYDLVIRAIGNIKLKYKAKYEFNYYEIKILEVIYKISENHHIIKEKTEFQNLYNLVKSEFAQDDDDLLKNNYFRYIMSKTNNYKL